MSEGYLFWNLVALTFLVLELFIPASFAFFFLSLAACVTSLLSVLGFFTFSSSFAMFFVISALVLLVFYKKWTSQWGKAQNDLINNKTFEALVGQEATIENIDGPFLIVKIGKHFWRARRTLDAHLKKGDKVIISGYQEMNLIIKPALDKKGSI